MQALHRNAHFHETTQSHFVYKGLFTRRAVSVSQSTKETCTLCSVNASQINQQNNDGVKRAFLKSTGFYEHLIRFSAIASLQISCVQPFNLFFSYGLQPICKSYSIENEMNK